MSGVSTFINALSQQNDLKNPFEFSNQVSQARTNALNVQKAQSEQTAGQLAQQAIDPETGVFDQARYQALLAKTPSAAFSAFPTIKDSTAIASSQLEQAQKHLGLIAGYSAPLINDPSDANVIAVRNHALASGLPPSQVNTEYTQLMAMNADQRRQYGYQQGVAALDALNRFNKTNTVTTPQNIGGVIVPMQTTQGRPGVPGSVSTGTGAIDITLSPGEVTGFTETIATQDDVAAGRATAIGQRIFIPNAELYRRAGIPPPPGLGSGGGGTGTSSVVNSDGTTASPTSPPRLLKVPGQTPATPPPAATTAAPLPIPPMPPAVVPPPSTATTAAPVTATTPPATTPPPPDDPFAAQKAQAKATGQEVPIPGGQGLVAKPDGNVGPPNRDSMMPRPRAALQGGVPVASANALLMPNVTSPAPPGAPNALVPGDVAAITAGINRARATPMPGTQTAFSGVPVGPGYDEQTTAAASQERLAADSKLAASYAGTVFPYTQALAGYGRGMTTAPGSDFLNAAKGFSGGVLRSMGINTPLSDDAASYDAQHKWLSQIITGNPVAQGSDARLAATLAGNANTGIHELAGADMMKAGIALMRMTAAARAEWDDPAVRAKYGYYNNFLRDFNKTIDPRAFAWDMYNPEQKKTLHEDLDKHDEAYAKKLQDSLALVRRNGYLGETRAMP